MSGATARRSSRLLGVAFVNVIVLIGLFLLAELVLHLVWRSSNPFLKHGEDKLRIREPIYTHTLSPNFDGYDAWGSTPFRIFTNSLGFRDGLARHVPLIADRKRIVFMGDSFTESLGVPYEQSFVGRFAQAFPELDVLNAAVSTYAPSVYYEKLKHYLEAGLRFDEVVVYVDIADIQDEAILYKYDDRGVLELGIFDESAEKCAPIARPPVPASPRGWLDKTFYIADFLSQSTYSRKLAAAIERASLEELAKSGSVYSRDWGRASWTYNENAACYGRLGVEGAIDKAKRQMDRLYELLSSYGAALSVGVYPWPQQLLYDNENSKQVRIWREWCQRKCERFFDHFPAFFRYKENEPDVVRKLYFWGDMHFNALGNRILADDLIEKYRQ